jgi:hypothetical protein
MPNHLEVLALATMLVVSGRAFALEDSYLPTGNIPYATEAPDQPQRLGPLWGERAKGPAGTLLKVPGNWRAVHAHTADYRAVVIQGLWAHWQMDGGGRPRSNCLRDPTGPRRPMRCMTMPASPTPNA